MQEAAKEPTTDARDLPDDVVMTMLTSLVHMRAFADVEAARAKTGDSFDRAPRSHELASVAGAIAALRREDGVFPSDVDRAAAIARGASMRDVAAHKVAWKSLRITPTGWHNGAHLVHAAGYGWAAKMRREDAVALALGPADVLETGEVHNALNFAGVFKTPAIFVVRIAEALVQEVRARGLEYGISVATVDGTDAIAVCKCVREARTRALTGGGATLVGAIVDAGKDPIAVLRKHVETAKITTREQVDAMHDAAAREAKSAFEGES